MFEVVTHSTKQAHTCGSYMNNLPNEFSLVHGTFYYSLISLGLFEPWNVTIWQLEKNINEWAWFQAVRSCLSNFWERVHSFGNNHLCYKEKTMQQHINFCIIFTITIPVGKVPKNIPNFTLQVTSSQYTVFLISCKLNPSVLMIILNRLALSVYWHMHFNWSICPIFDLSHVCTCMHKCALLFVCLVCRLFYVALPAFLL